MVSFCQTERLPRLGMSAPPTILSPDRDPPFQDVRDMHDTIDAIELGGVPWPSFTITFNENDDEEPDDAPWMTKSYEVWFRDPREILKLQLGNRDFAGEMDYAPKKVYDREKKKRRYQDFMSGQWAWDQTVSDQSDHLDILILSIQYRISSLGIQRIMGRHFAQSF